MKPTILLFILSGLGLCACGDNDPGSCDTSVPGAICTIAGNGDNGYDKGADDKAMPALEARMSLPTDTLTGPDGTIYIIDWNNHRIRTLDSDGRLRWLAGRGELGGSLDDPANGDFNHPTNIIFDSTGENLLIAAWHNSKIRSISLATGDVIDIAGNGGRAYFGDDGPALTSTLDLPASLAFDPEGNLVVMDQANQVLRFIDPDGDIHLLAGKCVLEVPGTCAEDAELVECPPRPDGSPSGKFTCGDPAMTCSAGGAASACKQGYEGDEQPASELRMAQPFGQSAAPAGRIAFDASGQLYFADSVNNLIRRIDTDGIVHRVAGVAPVDGIPQTGYDGDGGQAVDALLNFPVDLAFDDEGTLYFTDMLNHCVRAIGTDGIVSTVAGQCGVPGYEGDGGPAQDALLLRPFGLEYINGRLNIADTGNSVIRSIQVLAE